MPRCELQRRRNLACDPGAHLNPRGWYVPHLAWEGWEEFNLAVYALRCVILWRSLNRRRGDPLADIARIDSDMRSFHHHIATSRNCAKPLLP